MSPSVLSTRLRELRELGLVELRDEDGYRLTADGRSLLALLEPMREWTERWAAHLAQRAGAP
jgi:DNA-binding HxlR family transcriptional regulator